MIMNDFIVHTTERRDGSIAITRVRQIGIYKEYNSILNYNNWNAGLSPTETGKESI